MKRSTTNDTVAKRRRYAVLDVEHARNTASAWLRQLGWRTGLSFGLPEVDDRYHIWRVPLLNSNSKTRVGECVIDARSGAVLVERSTAPDVFTQRINGSATSSPRDARRRPPLARAESNERSINLIAQGDSETVLDTLPAGSVDLVFTSPPYYNARPEYTDYVTYQDYLDKMRAVIRCVHRVLADGRFFVLNVAPVLIRRTDRGSASRRIAVPFDFHRLFVEEGFDFIDDIIWLKPEGAGWATGRGRRFAADRNPMQYKAVPVTEYVLVYRRHTEKLIDWHIRRHPDRSAVAASKIQDGYERTNVWKITPAHRKDHPAVFPGELAEKVIAYYSFKGDTVLDPFAGVGTVGAAAAKLGRRFVLIERNPEYVEVIRQDASTWKVSDDVRALHRRPPDAVSKLF